MRIVESITDDVGTNAEIENKIDTTFQGDDRQVAMDLLDMVYLHKTIGMGRMMAHVKGLHPSADVVKIFRECTRVFSNLITVQFDSVSWLDAPAAEAPVDETSMIAQAASEQVRITYTVMEEMTKLDSFTIDDVRECLYDIGLQENMANMFADHIMQHFTNTAIRNTDGSLTIRPETKKKAADYINQWKSDAEKA